MKTGFLVGNLVLGLAVCDLKPIQAAQFSFSLADDYLGEVSGSLSFKESPLTGVGKETITLSALNNYCNTYICQELPEFTTEFPPYYLPLSDGSQDIQFGSFDDVTFEFTSGYLTGIFLSERQNFTSFEGRDPRFVSETEGYLEFSINRDTYDLSGLATVKRYQLSFEPVFDDDGNYLYDEEVLTLIEEFDLVLPGGSGEVEFSTTEPVPEPLTILGAMTALSFGSMFKRKLSKFNS
ncbi:PEP-CTERM sorting domain-containing protein [Gloeothece citriformis]|uniref:PEP-CTERM sorting domain-containing protein n=1 Tax=Gloeothece citriformis TaxID=2546356 RepID=UPI001EF064E2|nr:PEP-CTERM sorting domain-containing protein [Gloeothece citriformis]